MRSRPSENSSVRSMWPCSRSDSGTPAGDRFTWVPKAPSSPTKPRSPSLIPHPLGDLRARPAFLARAGRDLDHLGCEAGRLGRHSDARTARRAHPRPSFRRLVARVSADRCPMSLGHSGQSTVARFSDVRGVPGRSRRSLEGPMRVPRSFSGGVDGRSRVRCVCPDRARAESTLEPPSVQRGRSSLRRPLRCSRVRSAGIGGKCCFLHHAFLAA